MLDVRGLVSEGLLEIVRERATRHDADILGQVLTVSSAMAALGVELLKIETDEDEDVD